MLNPWDCRVSRVEVCADEINHDGVVQLRVNG
jgi:hypothetical protein